MIVCHGSLQLSLSAGEVSGQGKARFMDTEVLCTGKVATYHTHLPGFLAHIILKGSKTSLLFASKLPLNHFLLMVLLSLYSLLSQARTIM